MRSGLRALALCLLAVAVARSAAADEPLVIVLSWDGVRYDYLDRGEFPALGRMARQGARAAKMIPAFPASTFPNQVTLATGTYPDRHGIVANHFRDRKRGLYRDPDDASWIEAEPLWAAAERQGVRSAVLFWVGSDTDWNGIGPTYRKTPFDADLPESAKVEQILAWLAEPPESRPRLVMSWWRGCDVVGHRKGPDHADIALQLAAQDRELARLLEALDAKRAWDHTTLLVVSDHGMARVETVLDASAPLAAAGIEAEVIQAGGMAQLYLEDARLAERAAAALAALGEVAIHRREEIPGRLRIRHPRRTPDLLVIAEPPAGFRRLSWWERVLWATLGPLLGWTPGMHGHDPAHPDMAAIFLALGRGVPPGIRPAEVRAIDVAPTAARLLGIDPPRRAEGTALFAPPASPREDRTHR